MEARGSDRLVRTRDGSEVLAHAVRGQTQVVDGQGHGHFEALALLDRTTGDTEEVPTTALFVMIGTEPRTDWPGEAVARDDSGYLLTRTAVPREKGTGGMPGRVAKSSAPSRPRLPMASP